MDEISVNLINGICTIEWTSGIINDTIADSVVAILLSVDSSPASVKLSSKSCDHDHSKDPTHLEDSLADTRVSTRIKRITAMLEAQFGEAFTNNEDGKTAVIKIGKNEAKIDYYDLTVECSSNVLKGRVENVLNRATDLVAPLAQSRKIQA
ncbi:unnamed protein product [Wickerhamomyces anomalus]